MQLLRDIDDLGTTRREFVLGRWWQSDDFGGQRRTRDEQRRIDQRGPNRQGPMSSMEFPQARPFTGID